MSNPYLNISRHRQSQSTAESGALPFVKAGKLPAWARITLHCHPAYLLWIDARMADHHVAIQRDGQHGEQWHRWQSVAQQREQSTQKITMRPGAEPIRAGGQRQIEAAEQQIGQRQVNDKDGGGIANLDDGDGRIRLVDKKVNLTSSENPACGNFMRSTDHGNLFTINWLRNHLASRFDSVSVQHRAQSQKEPYSYRICGIYNYYRIHIYSVNIQNTHAFRQTLHPVLADITATIACRRARRN